MPEKSWTYLEIEPIVIPLQKRESCPVCASNSTFENYCSYCRRRLTPADSAPRLSGGLDHAALGIFVTNRRSDLRAMFVLLLILIALMSVLSR